MGLRLTGELDTLTGDLLEQRVEELLGERPDVILDLSEMRVRSASAGLMGWWSLSATSTPGTSGVESQYGIGPPHRLGDRRDRGLDLLVLGGGHGDRTANVRAVVGTAHEQNAESDHRPPMRTDQAAQPDDGRSGSTAGANQVRAWCIHWSQPVGYGQTAL